MQVDRPDIGAVGETADRVHISDQMHRYPGHPGRHADTAGQLISVGYSRIDMRMVVPPPDELSKSTLSQRCSASHKPRPPI